MLDLPYYSFNQYLRTKFGQAVWRVTLEGGFDCPNRDGLRAYGGCTFCTADGSSSRAQSTEDQIADQLIKGIEKQRRRHRAHKFIAYLQSFTNTYAPVAHLQKIYDSAIAHPDIVMLSIGTRPDCLPSETLALIETYNDQVEVWLDLGLQTIHNETLVQINRGHSAEEFFEAIAQAKKYAPRTKICAHMIAGLPGETIEDAYQTGLALSKLPIEGIKIHNLCVLKQTKIAFDYEQGLVQALGLDEYIELVIRILRILPPKMTIHRLMAEAPTKDELIAPLWANNKDLFLNHLREQMREQNVKQGDRLSAALPAKHG